MRQIEEALLLQLIQANLNDLCRCDNSIDAELEFFFRFFNQNWRVDQIYFLEHVILLGTFGVFVGVAGVDDHGLWADELLVLIKNKIIQILLNTLSVE